MRSLSLYSIGAFILGIGILVSSCDVITNTEADIDSKTEGFSPGNLTKSESDLPDYLANQLKQFESVTINTYVVAFENRELNYENGEVVSTTFHYSVSGTGETPQLDSFFLEVPQCAGTLLSYTPTQSANVEETGIKWNSSVSSTGTDYYSMTFAGTVHKGIIDATVTRGSIRNTGTVVGPCEGVYSLEGSIYIDANEDGIKQSSESGIRNVPIDLRKLGSNEIITSFPTSETGEFFIQVLEGSYTVTVDDDLLDESYNATTPITVELIDVAEDRSGIHFGYGIDSGKVTQELSDGTILINTEATKYWVQQIRQAGKRNSEYSQEEIRNFLIFIEELLLPEPFQFGEDKEKGALSILTGPTKTQLDEFLQQLLTAELNVVSSRGALTLVDGVPVLNEEYNRALLIYGEAIACEALGTCSSGDLNQSLTTQSFTGTASFTRDLTSDIELLSAFNGTGGIGTK